ncbi:uncharacterized protein LOC106651002 isoform X3 [Trichogramma pretiosum]|uniref:uncharacterized protein LOC106651002 isoform X3 n=1 Tax=Trichogramma pretiosum TaxID=7493 RepID=UPI000C71BF01|nr:uncharacterized protein LOC106651002 isoform X3 [Trichogramma pretiosum]
MDAQHADKDKENSRKSSEKMRDSEKKNSEKNSPKKQVTFSPDVRTTEETDEDREEALWCNEMRQSSLRQEFLLQSQLDVATNNQLLLDSLVQQQKENRELQLAAKAAQEAIVEKLNKISSTLENVILEHRQKEMDQERGEFSKSKLGDTPNPELRIITSVFNRVQFRGDKAPVRHLSLKALLPDTNGYMTYEGSTTHPGCWETAVWIILNKPIYITAQELYALRRLMQGPDSTPKAPLGNNSRPLQQLHHRTIRTNIDFRKRSADAKCPTMANDMRYKANTWRDETTLSRNHVI